MPRLVSIALPPGPSMIFAAPPSALMARAGVHPDIAERVMGHAIAGVEGVYDRHSYRDEKADALKRSRSKSPTS